MDDALTLNGVTFDKRELQLIGHSKHYTDVQAAFGAPGHNFMVLVAKLAKVVEQDHDFHSNHWTNTPR